MGYRSDRKPGKNHRKLLDDLRENRGYNHLKEDALDRIMWRVRFGRGFGSVEKQSAKGMNVILYIIHII